MAPGTPIILLDVSLSRVAIVTGELHYPNKRFKRMCATSLFRDVFITKFTPLRRHRPKHKIMFITNTIPLCYHSEGKDNANFGFI